MKPHKYAEPFLRNWKKKFLCINEEDRYIYGSFDTSIGRNIRIRLNRCRSEEENYCKTDEEITSFVKGKYLLIYKN